MKAFPLGNFDFLNYRAVDSFVPDILKRGSSSPFFQICRTLREIQSEMEALGIQPDADDFDRKEEDDEEEPEEDDAPPEPIDEPFNRNSIPKPLDSPTIQSSPTPAASIVTSSPSVVVPSTRSTRRSSTVPSPMSPSDEILVENHQKCDRCAKRKKSVVCYIRVDDPPTARCAACRKAHACCVYSPVLSTPLPERRSKRKACDPEPSDPQASSSEADSRPFKKSPPPVPFDNRSSSSLVGSSYAMGPPSSSPLSRHESSFEIKRLRCKLTATELALKAAQDQLAIETSIWSSEVESLQSRLERFTGVKE
jgi:hypothetical protein